MPAGRFDGAAHASATKFEAITAEAEAVTVFARNRRREIGITMRTSFLDLALTNQHTSPSIGAIDEVSLSGRRTVAVHRASRRAGRAGLLARNTVHGCLGLLRSHGETCAYCPLGRHDQGADALHLRFKRTHGNGGRGGR